MGQRDAYRVPPTHVCAGSDLLPLTRYSSWARGREHSTSVRAMLVVPAFVPCPSYQGPYHHRRAGAQARRIWQMIQRSVQCACTFYPIIDIRLDYDNYQVPLGVHNLLFRRLSDQGDLSQCGRLWLFDMEFVSRVWCQDWGLMCEVWVASLRGRRLWCGGGTPWMMLLRIA